jgi:hypothetical protein
MTEIPGLDRAIAELGLFTWVEFRFLRAMSFEVEQSNEAVVTLVLEATNLPARRRITLRATGVQTLRITDWGGTTIVGGFSANDISARQWEHLRWEVHDYEMMRSPLIVLILWSRAQRGSSRVLRGAASDVKMS